MGLFPLEQKCLTEFTTQNIGPICLQGTVVLSDFRLNVAGCSRSELPIAHGSFCCDLGGIVDDIFLPLEYVTYTCDHGYYLSGSQVRMCHSAVVAAWWDVGAPTCLREYCNTWV